MKKVVVGLGNPGSRYEHTRHNIGWMVLDRLADRHGAAGKVKEKDAAATARGRIGDDELILVKPLTYMNRSGQALARCAVSREAAPEEHLVVLDDVQFAGQKARGLLLSLARSFTESAVSSLNLAPDSVTSTSASAPVNRIAALYAKPSGNG